MRKHSRMGKREGNDDNPSLDISSLIDVSFLLLIYFLVTSTLDPTEADLALNMDAIPPVDKERVIDFEVPTIELNEAGVVFFQEEVLDSAVDQRELVMLLDRLKTYSDSYWIMNPDKSAKVNLRIADGAKGQRFIDVMNCLAEVGISDVTFLDME